jgi:pSer/pThr/pTyr-binding forkhead associated (FHA) protein
MDDRTEYKQKLIARIAALQSELNAARAEFRTLEEETLTTAIVLNEPLYSSPAQLIVSGWSDENEPQNIPIVKPSILIGRGDDCDIVINRREISRQHLRIFRVGNLYFAQDLESRNGTWTRLGQLSTQQLTNGEVINLARVAEIKFVQLNPSFIDLV